MSEIEINEGNCVLTEQELCVLNVVFKENIDKYYSRDCGKERKKALDKIFLKIAKLNEMAKEKQK